MPPKHPGRTGRRTKLTPELRDRICAAVRTGAYLETAAVAAGLNKTTLHDWLKRGARAKRGTLHDFSNSVMAAIADSEQDAVRRLSDAASPRTEVTTKQVVNKAGEVVTVETTTTPTLGDWRADAWRLERKFPERWGATLRIRHVVDKQVTDVLSRLEKKLPASIFRQVLDALDGCLEEGDPGAEGDATAPVDGSDPLP